jgi:AcrR family transcriptional regulator
MADRRVRRTRRVLHVALIELILEKGYQRTTVQDILDRADVGRSTFYAHYRDKDSLLLSTFDDLRVDLYADIESMWPGEPIGDPSLLSRALFVHAYNNQIVYRALCGKASAGTVAQRHLHDMIGDILHSHLRPHLDDRGAPIPSDLVSEFCASALIGMLVWYVQEDFAYDPTWMAQAYGALTIPGIMAALDHPGAGGGGRHSETQPYLALPVGSQ